MAITVKNIHAVNNEDYRKELEDRINAYFTKNTGKNEYIEIPIRSTAYHNNGLKVFPIDVCKSLLPELKAAGFYCYFTRPSFKYDDWTDFCVSTYIRTSTQGNVREL